MKPKNSKERRNSILKFLLLFVCTVVLIVVTIFFDYDTMPIKENAVLREQSVNLEKEVEFQEKFSNQMKNVRSLLDSLDTPNQNLKYINGLLTAEIVKLRNSIPPEDVSFRSDMYNNIVQSYVDLQEYKSELREFDEVNTKLKQNEAEISKLNEELDKANKYLEALRR